MNISIEFDKTKGLTIDCQIKPLIFQALIAAGAGAGIAWLIEICKAIGWI
jgi:hypothetical protein